MKAVLESDRCRVVLKRTSEEHRAGGTVSREEFAADSRRFEKRSGQRDERLRGGERKYRREERDAVF
jgi:hypothetical protein